MGGFCRICHTHRPNESFSGHGHTIGICRKCSGKPKEEITNTADSQFLHNVLHNQKVISAKNIKMLDKIASRGSGEVSKMARAIAEVGRHCPQRKKRMGRLYHHHRELFDKLVAFGFIDDFITPMIEEEKASEQAYAEYRARNSETCWENEKPGIHTAAERPGFASDDELPF